MCDLSALKQVGTLEVFHAHLAEYILDSDVAKIIGNVVYGCERSVHSRKK